MPWPRTRRDTATAVALLLVLIGLAAFMQLAVLLRNPLLFFLNLLVAVALSSTGLFLSGLNSDARTTSFFFLLSGALWPTLWLSELSDIALARDVANYGSSLFWVCLGSAVLLYPTGRVELTDKLVLAFGAVTIIGAEILAEIHLIDLRASIPVLKVLYVAYSIALVVVFVRGVRRRPTIRRRALVPIGIALATVCLTASLNTERFFPPGIQVEDDFYIIMDLALLTIPLAFAIAWISPRLLHAKIVGELLELPWPTQPEDFRGALRRALSDDDLEVYYPTHYPEELVDSFGRPAAPEQESDRSTIDVVLGSHFVCRLAVNSDLEPYADSIASAASTAALALHSAQLRAEVLAQAERARKLQLSVEEVRWEERRSLERDLHDGVQLRLSAISAMLGSAAYRIGMVDGALGMQIERIRTEVSDILGDLRNIANGIAPETLAEFGLGATLEGVAESFPLPVVLHAPSRRLSPIVEVTAYFVIAECLANILKHSRATRCEVKVAQHDSIIVVTVSDDGCGGVDQQGGSGLRGLVGRVSALGGELAVRSPAGGGTTVEVSMPCE